jgi:hypothetical protein
MAYENITNAANLDALRLAFRERDLMDRTAVLRAGAEQCSGYNEAEHYFSVIIGNLCNFVDELLDQIPHGDAIRAQLTLPLDINGD